MKGRISKIWRNGIIGSITGYDGNEYFFNRHDFNFNSTIRVDWIVEFDVITQEDGDHAGELAAINIKKIGHGKHHPLAIDAQRIGEDIAKYMPDDCEEKQYRLRDIDTIYRYFCNVEDYGQFTNPREQFRPHGGM